MKQQPFMKTIRQLLVITIGIFIYAVSVNSVTIPNDLGGGGVTGLALLLYYSFGISPALTNIVVNAVIMLYGWRILERRTTYYTLYAIVVLSLFLDRLHLPSFVPDNSILVPIVAGVLSGIGLGMVILAEGTTAGTDIIAVIMNKLTGLSVSSSLMIIDFVIIVPLIFVVGAENTVLSVVCLYIMTQVMNFVMEGFNPKKSFFIVSDQHEAIAQRITQEIDRGITIFYGKGYYSQEDKPILYVVVNQMQLRQAQRIVQELDPDAFMTISQVQEVHGEGFTFFVDN